MTQLPILQQRQIEAKILKHVFETLRERLGQEQARDVIRETVSKAAIQQGNEVAGVFSGHVHCENFCCRANATTMCFAQHSTTAGYVCPSEDISSAGFRYSNEVDEPLHGIGMRLIELHTKDDTWKVETRIALINGTSIYRRVLAEGAYPAT